MKNLLVKETIYYLILALLTVLFLYTGISKLLDFQGFLHAMQIQPFPNKYAIYPAWGIPLLEIAITITFFFNRTRLTGLYASFVLMSLFTVYAILVLMHVFPFVPCSCGGILKSLKWEAHLWFNIFFTAISLCGILIHKKSDQGLNAVYV
jgi:putative oxidoreductase